MAGTDIKLNTARIETVDALRGFAIIAILLLHNSEHFCFYYLPENQPEWLRYIDAKLMNLFHFLFTGKAYGIFAFLFGFSFFIQHNNQMKKGRDFSGRFIWRMNLLLCLGTVNSIFYQADILTIYAVLGIMLVPARKWSNGKVLFIAVILLLQPWQWLKVIYVILNPEYTATQRMSEYYLKKAIEYMGDESFLNFARGNLWYGKLSIINGGWENGRFFQIVSLFYLGMLAGRRGYFNESGPNFKFWKNTMILSMLIFIPLYFLRQSIVRIVDREALCTSLYFIATSWSNLSFVFFLISSFVLVYRHKVIGRMLGMFIPFGKMSLTSYMMQSVMGSAIYYAYGLGLYKYSGVTCSIAIGLCQMIVQLTFCLWWLENHTQGPVEYIWSRLTWLGNIRKMPAGTAAGASSFTEIKTITFK